MLIRLCKVALNRNKLYNELDKIKICFDNKVINNDKLLKLLNISEIVIFHS